jgi:hypothetical protein
MHIRSRGGRWTLYKQKRSVTAVSQSCRLWEQASVNQGRGEIADRLPLNQHLVVDQIVSYCQTDHPNVKRAAPLQSMEQRGLSFGVVDIDSMNLIRHGERA